MEAETLSNLKDFIQQCKNDPCILNHRSVSFFTDYLHGVGCKLPPSVYRYGDNRPKSYEVDDGDEDDRDDEDVLSMEELRDLKKFIRKCKNGGASFLKNPSFSFFNDYLNSFGCYELPSPGHRCGPSGDAAWDYDSDLEDDMVDDDMDEDDMDEDDMDDSNEMVSEAEEEEIVQSDVEFEGEIVEPDDDPPQKMGDSSVKVTEENRDAAQEAKGKAMGAVSEGKHEEAIEHLTHAVMLNPASAMMYATRASVYIKMKKPVAAIRDADAAIEINPDLAKCHKSRGMAQAMLGKWKEAAKDLQFASKIDYDEEIGVELKKVESNVRKIEENQQKYDRLRKEREDRKAESERQRRKAKAETAAHVEAKKGEVLRLLTEGMPETGGMSGGFDYNNAMFKVIRNDPEIMEAIQNSEFFNALKDVVKDAANFEKYKQNPRVGPMLAKLFALNLS